MHLTFQTIHLTTAISVSRLSRANLQGSLEGKSANSHFSNSMFRGTHLISITPVEVLGSDVLVWVFGSLLQRLHVLPVGPMLIPQDICVGTGNEQRWDSHAAKHKRSACLHSRNQGSTTPPLPQGILTR